MADINLVGDAVPAAAVKTGTLDTYDAATTYKVTVGGRVVSTVGTGGTTTTTATALRALLNASTYPEFEAITWSGATNAIIGTADEAGKEFAATLTVSGGTGTVTDFAITTANDGPNAVTAQNFKSTAGVRGLPVDSDNLYLSEIDVDLNYNLDALSSVTPAATHIKASYEGQIWLPFYDEDADPDHANYLTRYFTLDGSTACYIGEGDGDGSSRIMLDLKAIQSAVLVAKMAESEDDYHSLILKGTHASNTLKIEGGSVDIAPFAGETATFATLTVTGEGVCRTGYGTTLGTVNVENEAEIVIHSAASLADITAINVRDEATCTIRGDNAVTAATVNGSSAVLNIESSGTFTTVNLYDGGTLDLENNPTGVTITTLNVYGPCTINDPNDKLTVTNAISNWSQVTFNGSPKRGVTLSAP